ncbi:hypothetical protein CSKR_200617 [Clonorchis sinensis]|uniref:Uncharacterized protein n=1 Tax=Clonorchis sinensis TaxID=79923 RepID=A0A419QH42_CLOSI|nr:hypothetical protein CSKR_200617 [Clonorchis sinensis]
MTGPQSNPTSLLCYSSDPLRRELRTRESDLRRPRSFTQGHPIAHNPWDEMAQWLEREFTGRKVLGSNPTSASRLLLSRLGQPDSISALVFRMGGMVARRRKGATAERLP